MFLAILIPCLVVLVIWMNWFIIHEIDKALPNATRQQRRYELSKAWASAGLSLASLPKSLDKPKVPKTLLIEEDDTPT